MTKHMTIETANAAQALHRPAELQIHPRNERFDFAGILATDWANGDPVRTAFWNALSSMFPVGEKFFVDSVKKYAGQVTDERLRRDVRGFIGQEAVHSREHAHYNELLCQVRGYDLDELESRLKQNIARAEREIPAIGNLAITVAYEHFTAILANRILADPKLTEGMPAEMRRMWIWHAIEETEHKSVAFDVFLHVGGERGMLVKAFVYVTKEFIGHIYRNAFIMLRGSELSKPVQTLRLTRIIAANFWSVRREWRDFFRADFHPWQHDNRSQLDRALAAYGAPAF